MAAAASIAIAGLAVTVAGTAVSFIGQRQAQKAAAKRAREAADERARARALEEKRANIQASRQRRRAAAEARRFRASAVNLANNRGAGGAIGAQGSTIPGVSGNIQSQLNYNNAFINRVTDLNSQISSAFGNAQDIASRPITAGSGLMAFGSLAASAGGFMTSNAGSISKFVSPSSAPTSAGSSMNGRFGMNTPINRSMWNR